MRNGAMYAARIEGLVPVWAMRMFGYLEGLAATDDADYDLLHGFIASSAAEVLSAPTLPSQWAARRGVGTFGKRKKMEDNEHRVVAEE